MKKALLLFRILTKRMLLEKSVWITLVLTVCVTAGIVKAESVSRTVIFAAVYAKDSGLAEQLATHEGLVCFVPCESAEEVKQNVIKGKAECGYVLGEDLLKEIAAGRGYWSIEVWERGDSAVTYVIDEILFETLFSEIAVEWYGKYIAEHPAFQNTAQALGKESLQTAAKEAFLEKLEDGSTFTLESSRLEGGLEAAKEDKRTYPVPAGVGLCILLCVLAGTAKALEDVRKGRFYRQPAAWVRALTIGLPTMLGYGAGVVTIWLADKSLLTLSMAGVLLGIAVLGTGVGMLLVLPAGRLRARNGSRR